MVVARSLAAPCQVEVTGSTRTLIADTTAPRGAGEGFRPHELLEAALASCMTMMMRIAAQGRGVDDPQIETQVDVDRSDPERTVFRVSLDLTRVEDPHVRSIMAAAVEACPIKKTLSKPLEFAMTVRD